MRGRKEGEGDTLGKGYKDSQEKRERRRSQREMGGNCTGSDGQGNDSGAKEGRGTR